MVEDILLVVFGHYTAGEWAKNLDIFGYTHYLIYAVHMPMFIFISGIVSKKKKTWRELFEELIIPYVIFDLLYAAFDLLKGGGISGFFVIVPIYAYWYICCLAIFRLLISYIPWKKTLVFLTIVLTFTTPFVGEELWRVLALGRGVLLFGLFYLGYKTDWSIFTKIREMPLIYKIGVLIAGFICIVVELVLLAKGVVSIRWATHNQPVSIRECLLKYLFMLFTIIIFAALAILVKGKNKKIIRWGRNSIMVYLCHPFIVPFVKKLQMLLCSLMNISSTWVLYIISLMMVAGVVQLLSCEYVISIYRSGMNKVNSILKI